MSVQELRMRFSEAYSRVINNAPVELREHADCSLSWEKDFTFPHIDKNFVKQLPEPIINELVDLYEHLRTGNL
ncbi:MAG: hypothetical protein P4L41_15895 [Flavipsychrobacter sp.]|nr:hypothetical protein [Flavipsychrobacter sp.]